MFYNTKTKDYLSTRELRDLVYDVWDETIDDNWMAETIDSCTDPIQIFGCTYLASEVFVTMDPVAYRCAMTDEVEYQTDETMYEIEHTNFKENESLEWFGLDFVIYKEGEETEE